jgi:hypothetical protein
MRTRFTAAVVAALAVAAAGAGVALAGTAGAAAPAPGQRAVTGRMVRPGAPLTVVPDTVTDSTTYNWSGYVAKNPTRTTNFLGVHARWKQPAATCTSSNPWTVFWVGLDGAGSNAVEQGGSEAYCVSGTVHYAVWWEMFPHNSIQTDFAIAAGDTIDASVTYDPGTALYSIVVTDVTSNKTLTRNVPCYAEQDCERLSAEVVSEVPTKPDGTMYDSTRYRTATYSQVSITDVNGHTGPLTDPAWQLEHVNQIDHGNLVWQATSPMSADGTSFSTTIKDWPVVRQGQTGEAVRTVQYLLRQQGNAGLTVDGDFGAKTLAAVKAFQTAKGLGADGIVGAQTWAALVLTLQQGSTGDAVKALQSQLTAHNLATTVNGTFDQATATNLKTYQTTLGLPATATTDPSTWRYLVG